MSPPPIFIVGPPRSGTELMRSVLNRHSQIRIAHETHYFDDLRPRLRAPAAPLVGSDRDRAERYFGALAGNAYGLHDAQAGVRESLAEGASADAAFADHCRRAADDKPGWGEKTPRHVFRVPEILAAFPEARIVAMVRDPRAVAASYRDWRNRWFAPEAMDAELTAAVHKEEERARRTYDLTVIGLLWMSAARTAARRARERPDRVRLVPFERLIAEPDVTVQGLMGWLGMTYEPGMLEVEVRNSSYLDAASHQGFVRGVEDRWRETLSADEMAYLDWLTGAAAAGFGYPRSGARLRPGFALGELAGTPIAVVRAALANNGRIANLPAYILARLAGVVGR